MSRTNFDILPIPTQKNAEELVAPRYVAVTPSTDISGCDSSGNPLDKSGNAVNNLYCGFFQTYECSVKDASGNATCEVNWKYLGPFIGFIILGLLLVILFSILASRSNDNKNTYVTLAVISFITFWIVAPLITYGIFAYNYPSS